MAFKMAQEGGKDCPTLICGVCGEPIWDVWSDLASGTRPPDGLGGAVVLHHRACPTTEPNHVTLAQFFFMYLSRRRVGDLASNGASEKVTLEFPSNTSFE